MKTFETQCCEDWRKWLAAHHAKESEVWLVFYKRQTGRPSIAYSDALDEALCFGWIDSLIKRLDDDRYARKFTPRKPNSRWSEINRKRFAQLEAAGRLQPAGRKRPPTSRTYDVPPALSSEVPPYIRQAIRKEPAAWSFFETLAPSYRRMYIGWIEMAKSQETKSRRLREAVDLLAAGKKLGLK